MSNQANRPVDIPEVRHEMRVTAEKLRKRIDICVEDGLMTPETASRLRQAIKDDDWG